MIARLGSVALLVGCLALVAITAVVLTRLHVEAGVVVGVASVVTAAAALLAGVRNRSAIESLSVNVDGRLSELLAARAAASKSAGKEEERIEARGRASARGTDKQ